MCQKKYSDREEGDEMDEVMYQDHLVLLEAHGRLFYMDAGKRRRGMVDR